MHVCIYIYLYMCICIFTYEYMDGHVHICMYMYIYIYIYISAAIDYWLILLRRGPNWSLLSYAFRGPEVNATAAAAGHVQWAFDSGDGGGYAVREGEELARLRTPKHRQVSEQNSIQTLYYRGVFLQETLLF